jgi:hypothetical protein
MNGDHNMNQTSPGWRKRQIALDKMSENARELGLDYEPSIVEMARQAGMVYRQFEDEFANANTDAVDLKTLEAFAELVRANERELCAKVCEELVAPEIYSNTDVSMWDVTCIDCAEAIRARSLTPCTHEWVDDTKDKPTWRCAKCNCEYTKGQL